MSAQPIRRRDREVALLAWLTVCVSVLSLLFYFRRGDILLYGDAVAHINIARRVFDSRTPGLLQLGTVWLPLPHLLMIPFLLSSWMWKTGVGGSIPSMAAYVFGAIGIFRLVRDGLGSPSSSPRMVRFAAWLAAVIYAANPNLIYLQATAMTESLYLALFIWAVVYFNQFVRESGEPDADARPLRASPALIKSGLCLAGACLTRYDAWFLAVAMCAGALAVAAAKAKQTKGNPDSEGELAKFSSACGGRPRALAGLQRYRLSQSAGVRYGSILSESHRAEKYGGVASRRPRPSDRLQLFPEVSGAESRCRKLAEGLDIGCARRCGRQPDAERRSSSTLANTPALGSFAVLCSLRRL